VPVSVSDEDACFLPSVKDRLVVQPEKPIKETTKYSSMNIRILEPKEVESDGNFIKNKNGVVFDTKTNLERCVPQDNDRRFCYSNI
jgi:hypothetical protein